MPFRLTVVESHYLDFITAKDYLPLPRSQLG